MHVNCNSIDKHCPVFFFRRFVFRIREITYANNCVFHYVHKEIENAFSLGVNYSFCESGLQITLRLLSSSLGNTVGYNNLISNKREWNNCFIKNNQEMLLDHADFALQEQAEDNI